MVRCPNCGQKTSGDYCQWCKYPILKGGVFHRLKEKLRTKKRDDLCAELRAIGLDARMAERGRAEEKTGDCSLGLIDIPGGPIRWVNVRAGARSENITVFCTDYAVPDPRLGPNFRKLKIHSVHLKTFPLMGRVADLQWKGKDLGLGIIGRLNSDISVKDPIVRSRDNVTIDANGDHRCWLISIETLMAPSKELWNCYQAIARHLLADWPTAK